MWFRKIYGKWQDFIKTIGKNKSGIKIQKINNHLTAWEIQTRQKQFFTKSKNFLKDSRNRPSETSHAAGLDHPRHEGHDLRRRRDSHRAGTTDEEMEGHLRRTHEVSKVRGSGPSTSKPAPLIPTSRFEKDDSKTVNVKMDLAYESSKPCFDFDTDIPPRTMARALAKEMWSREYFDNLRRWGKAIENFHEGNWSLILLAL